MTTSLTKSAKNDFINEERGVDNSIGEESTTNNKFDEESITNGTIEEESVRRESVDEDAVKKDEAARSSMSRRLCRVRTSRRANQVNAQSSVSPDYQSRCRVSGVQEFEYHRVKRERPGRDQTSEVSSGNTRSDLRRRQQWRVIEDANEDCQSAPDAIH